MTTGKVFIAAKPPVPGLVKTRLARAIGEAASAELYAAFLDDIAGMIRQSSLAAGWFIPRTPLWEPPSLGAAQLATRWQDGDTWGVRQARLFEDAFATNAGPVVLVASDSPQLEATDLHSAFDELLTHDVVLGPVLDGGYYLVGMRSPHPILAPVAMSTGTVAAEVLARARGLGLGTSELPSRFDIDEVEDLDHLAASSALHLTATRSWMERASRMLTR
ncbi:MAG: TIGR04282 family arsenosugar biosynthesis glycosyltransferase [Candidatus Dormibacteria bacterium]